MLRLLRSEVIQIIEPFLDPLYRIGAMPFERYQAEYPNKPLHSSRTRACIMYDLMVDQARQEFLGVRDTEIIDRPNGVTLLQVSERICVRFKKLDEDGLPSNYPTAAARNWEKGEDLPGIPSALQRLCLGYRLNRLQTRVEDVLISNTLAGRLLYDIILEEPAEGLLLMDGRKGVVDVGDQGQRPQRRVRIRPSEEQTEL
jgi:hypothetical protein